MKKRKKTTASAGPPFAETAGGQPLSGEQVFHHLIAQGARQPKNDDAAGQNPRCHRRKPPTVPYSAPPITSKNSPGRESSPLVSPGAAGTKAHPTPPWPRTQAINWARPCSVASCAMRGRKSTPMRNITPKTAGKTQTLPCRPRRSPPPAQGPARRRVCGGRVRFPGCLGAVPQGSWPSPFPAAKGRRFPFQNLQRPLPPARAGGPGLSESACTTCPKGAR